MAGNLASIAITGASAGNQALTRAGSERKADKAIIDIAKALKESNTVAAQKAVQDLRGAVPTQNAATETSDAVKALDQALKSNDLQKAAEAFANLQQARQRAQGNAARNPASAQPQVGGATVQRRADRPEASGTSSPAPRSSDDTRVKQQAANDAAAADAAQKAFLTRQELAAKAADQRKEPSEKGQRINVTA
ncbi:hypothetical protein [Massilia sp. TS11]|uniref:hypothetical protein n=1 Tax=Massilia sp. TS11 TaxID=2908003 RepID=UPI001EDBBC23|nr:hypothetical protein [Massilia sp. TS11]MCG2583489.1 hypothetical protein [Massilia sp. TS11]